VSPWNNDAQGVGISCRLKWVQIMDPVYYDGAAAHKTVSGKPGHRKEERDWFKPRAKPQGPQGPAAPKTFDVDGQEVDDLLDEGLKNIGPEFLNQ
jgi:hypothetical protein